MYATFSAVCARADDGDSVKRRDELERGYVRWRLVGQASSVGTVLRVSMMQM